MAFRVSPFKLVLSPADLRLPLFRSKFLSANSIVLNSEYVGYNTQWN